MTELLTEKIHSVLKGGDILFIVPPFVTTRTPVLGPHILQTIARKRGYRTDILHLNLLLASVIGVNLYESVSYGQPFRLLGERLFARSAYGLPPLGKSPELCTAPRESVFGKDGGRGIEEFEYKYTGNPSFDMETFLKVEETCTSFMETVGRVIAALDYPITGCSANWEQINCSIALLNRIKALCPGRLTLMGGSNCEGPMAEGMASLTDAVDYIFSGEGEASFARFLDNYAAGKRPSQKIIRGEPCLRMDDIDLPDYDGYITQRETFFGSDVPGDVPGDWTMGYETSRGCWWGKCYFCGMNGVDRAPFRQKSAAKALADLEEIHRCYPGRGVVMVDKVMPVSYREELLPELGQKENLPLTGYEQRPDLPLQSLIHLKKANVLFIKPGIETLSGGLLKSMNKGVTARQNVLLLRTAASLGINVDWNLLWGFPGEKNEYYRELADLIPLLHHFSPPRVFRHICIDRFSPYFEEPGRFQIKNLRPWAVYNTVFPDRAEVDKLAYRFIGNYPCETHEHPELIREVARAVECWKRDRGSSTLAMIPMMDFYMIYDKRGIPGKSKNHVVDAERAAAIMTCRTYDDSEHLNWAVEHRLGVLLDSHYVPLVTAAADLLEEFENKLTGNSHV